MRAIVRLRTCSTQDSLVGHASSKSACNVLCELTIDQRIRSRRAIGNQSKIMIVYKRRMIINKLTPRANNDCIFGGIKLHYLTFSVLVLLSASFFGVKLKGIFT